MTPRDGAPWKPARKRSGFESRWWANFLTGGYTGSGFLLDIVVYNENMTFKRTSFSTVVAFTPRNQVLGLNLRHGLWGEMSGWSAWG